MEDFSHDDRIENVENNRENSELNLLSLVESTRLPASAVNNTDLHALGFPATTIVGESNAGNHNLQADNRVSQSNNTSAEDERSMLAPRPALTNSERYGVETHADRQSPSPRLESQRSQFDIIAERWQLSVFPSSGNSSQLNEHARADMPAVADALFAGDRHASRVVQQMLNRGVSANIIEDSLGARLDRAMRSATAQRPLSLSPDVLANLEYFAQQNTRDGNRPVDFVNSVIRDRNQSMNSLISIARGGEGISRESAVLASGSLERITQNPEAAARFAQATRTESRSFFNDALVSLRSGSTINMNPLQFAFVNIGLAQGDSSAIEIASRMVAGHGAASQQMQEYFGTRLSLLVDGASPSERDRIAGQVISSILQSGPTERSMVFTRNLGERYPGAMANVIGALRTQSQSENISSRDSAYSQLAFVAAGGFGRNAQSETARNILINAAQTSEGMQRVNTALDANTNRGVNNDINQIRRAIESNSARPSDQQMISANQARIMRETFPNIDAQELRNLSQQIMNRHGEAGLQRFLSNAQMYQSASPELRNYLSSTQPLSANPSPADDLLSHYSSGSTRIDLNSALRQFSQGELQGDNSHLSNVHVRMNELVSAMQRQLGANESAIRAAHQQYSEGMSGMSWNLRPNFEPPTLGPRSPRPSTSDFLQRAQSAQQDISRFAAIESRRTEELNRALGIQLLGTHALLSQQDPAAADSLAIMAGNYIASSQLPSQLRNEVSNSNGTPGPAIERAASRRAAVDLVANSSNALELIRRSSGLPDNGRDSLTNSGLDGMSILQGIGSGRLQLDAQQMQVEARAAQVYGAARVISANSNGFVHLNERLGDLSSLQNFAGIGGRVANSERSIREFIANEFQSLENLIAPIPHSGFPVIDNTRAAGAVDRTPNPQAEHQEQLRTVQSELDKVRRATALLAPEQRNTEAGRQLILRERGLGTLENLMNPNSQLNANLRNLIVQFRDQNVSISEQFLRQAAPILMDLAIAAAAASAVGVGSAIAIARVGRIANMLLSNPMIRNAVQDEAVGAVQAMLGVGEAGPLTNYISGRTDLNTLATSMAQSQVENLLYSRFSSGVQNRIAIAGQNRFRYGASLINNVGAPAVQFGVTNAVSRLSDNVSAQPSSQR